MQGQESIWQGGTGHAGKETDISCMVIITANHCGKQGLERKPLWQAGTGEETIVACRDWRGNHCGKRTGEETIVVNRDWRGNQCGKQGLGRKPW